MLIVLNMTTGLIIWCSEAITLAAVFLLAWWHDRRSPAYLMWALGFIVNAIGFALVAARGFIPDILSVEIGNAIALLGESAWIAGFRWLDKRKLEWSALLPPVIWLVGVSLPWVNDSFVNRIIVHDLAGAVGATLLACAVRPAEGRREQARGQLGFVFMALACLCFVSSVGMALFAPTQEEALIYRGYVALGDALFITVAVALMGKLLMERAERRWRAISITDTLTGVLNRRGLQDSYAILAGEGQRQPQKLAALLFDLDHFKTINDRYGHQTGDLVLIRHRPRRWRKRSAPISAASRCSRVVPWCRRRSASAWQSCRVTPSAGIGSSPPPIARSTPPSAQAAIASSSSTKWKSQRRSTRRQTRMAANWFRHSMTRFTPCDVWASSPACDGLFRRDLFR